MSYQSGDKKNILGHRLSNRYLSSDAFTSSAGKTGGRSISRLGSLFTGQKHNRRYSGTGQKVGLIEMKNIFVKFCIIVACLIVVLYTLPFTRYWVHGFFAQYASVYDALPLEKANDSLQANERYVSPALFNTDRFAIDVDGGAAAENGSYVYAAPMDTLVGTLEVSTSSTPEVVLFSEVGFKNNLFIENTAESVSFDTPATTTEVLDITGTSSTEQHGGDDTAHATQTISHVTHVDGYSSVIFEGLGYGQMIAKVPPQMEIPVGTVLYARTPNGLQPAGKVSYVETDTGSTFTNIYAQILTAPYAIYKVKLTE
jgi:hypothetical protein